MSTQSIAKPEVLLAPKRPLRSRLWFRIVRVLIVAYFISLATWCWPRRTMIAVWWANGSISSESQRERARQVMFFLRRHGWSSWKQFHDLWTAMSWLSPDGDVTFVGLKDSNANNQWLGNLRPLSKLQGIYLHDRQLGTGLDFLQDLKQLKSIAVSSASNRHLIELQRLPKLDDVTLIEPQSGDIGLDVLSKLPLIKSLWVEQCSHADQLLKQIPEHSQIESFLIRESQGYVDDDLAMLLRLPNLKFLTFESSAPIGDAGLLLLSRLEHLEHLSIRKSLGPVTDAGLNALPQMKKLKTLTVDKSDLSPEQLNLLKQLLPNVTVLVR